jgi:hypothetical protein
MNIIDTLPFVGGPRAVWIALIISLGCCLPACGHSGANGSGAVDDSNGDVEGNDVEESHFSFCAEQDTWVGVSESCTSVTKENHDGRYVLVVGVFSDGEMTADKCGKLDARILLGFDLSELPTNRRVREATLGLTGINQPMMVGTHVPLALGVITEPWNADKATGATIPAWTGHGDSFEVEHASGGTYDITDFLQWVLDEHLGDYEGIIVYEDVEQSPDCQPYSDCSYCCGLTDLCPEEGGCGTYCPLITVEY